MRTYLLIAMLMLTSCRQSDPSHNRTSLSIATAEDALLFIKSIPEIKNWFTCIEQHGKSNGTVAVYTMGEWTGQWRCVKEVHLAMSLA